MNLLTHADARYTHVSNTILKELFLSILEDTWKNTTNSCHSAIYLKVHSQHTFKPLSLNKQWLLKSTAFTAFNIPIWFCLFCNALALTSFSPPNLPEDTQGNDTGNTLPLLGRAPQYHILKAQPSKQAPYPLFHTESQIRGKKGGKKRKQHLRQEKNSK